MFIFSQKNLLDALHISQPFRADAFAVFLVLKGEFNFQCNLTSYALKANSIFFAIPGSLFELQYFSPDISFVGLSFDKDYLEKQQVHFTSSETIYLLSADMKPHCVLTEDECKDLCNAIAALEKKSKLAPQTPFIKEILHYSFLSVIYDAASVFNRRNVLKNVRLTRKEELATSFLNLLLANFKKERSVQFYADALYITARHLSQVVKEVTGKTAGELIDEAVINEAKVLLTAPVMNVAMAAETLEFSNQSFFGKYFKKHTGFSPSDYRANSRISNNPPF